MAIPKYNEFMKPMLMLLGNGNVYRLNEISRILARQFELSSDELSELLPSGRQTIFRNRVGWAKSYLKKAGLLDYPGRAALRITDTGKAVLLEDPPQIDAKYLERFPSFRESSISDISHRQTDSEANTNIASDLTPDDQLEDAINRINSSLAADLLGEVMKISPYTFEKFVIDLLSRIGYGTIAYGSHTTAMSRDNGIDGVIMKDKLGFSLIYMQAKQWALDRTVGQPEIQNFVGAIAGKHGDGLFVTTTTFTQKAKDYADQHHIILV